MGRAPPHPIPAPSLIPCSCDCLCPSWGLSQAQEGAGNSKFPKSFLRFVSKPHVQLLRAFAVFSLLILNQCFLSTPSVKTIGQVSLGSRGERPIVPFTDWQ